MSLLLFFLCKSAIADNVDSKTIKSLYDRQHSINNSQMMLHQSVDHYLPVGYSIPGSIVSHKTTLSKNHEALRLMLETENKGTGLKHCDIGLIAYYFISDDDYKRLVGDQNILKIVNNYHIFFNESDNSIDNTIRLSYKTIILSGCE